MECLPRARLRKQALFLIPSLGPKLESHCTPPKESLDVFLSQEQEAVIVPLQRE